MLDISLCTNVLCPSKECCYRFTAKPNEFRQTYINFSLEEDEINCSYFYPNVKNFKKCKIKKVKSEMCDLDACSYPKCVQDDYCKYCHQTENKHKMSCTTQKIQVNL